MAILRGPDRYALAEEQLAALPPADRHDSAICSILHSAIPTYTWVGIYRAEAGDLVLAAWDGNGQPRSQRIDIAAGRVRHEENDLRDQSQHGRFLATARSETQLPFTDEGEPGLLAIASDHRGAFGPADRDLLQLVVAMLEKRGR